MAPDLSASASPPHKRARTSSTQADSPEIGGSSGTDAELSLVKAPGAPDLNRGDFMGAYQHVPDEPTQIWDMASRPRDDTEFSRAYVSYSTNNEQPFQANDIQWDNPHFNPDGSLQHSMFEGIPSPYAFAQGNDRVGNGNPFEVEAGQSISLGDPMPQYVNVPHIQAGGSVSGGFLGPLEIAGLATSMTEATSPLGLGNTLPPIASALPGLRPEFTYTAPSQVETIAPAPPTPVPAVSTTHPSAFHPATAAVATTTAPTIPVVIPPKLPIDAITRPDRTRPRKRPAKSPVRTPERIPFVRVHAGMTAAQRKEAEAHNAAAAANRAERDKVKNNKAAKRSRARKDAQLDAQFRELAQLRWEVGYWKGRAVARGETDVRFDWSRFEAEFDEVLRRQDEEALEGLPLAKGEVERHATEPTTPDADADAEGDEE